MLDPCTEPTTSNLLPEGHSVDEMALNTAAAEGTRHGRSRKPLSEEETRNRVRLLRMARTLAIEAAEAGESLATLNTVLSFARDSYRLRRAHIAKVDASRPKTLHRRRKTGAPSKGELIAQLMQQACNTAKDATPP